MKKIGLIVLTIVTMLAGCGNQDEASVGIIGGADGPTAIFVAGKPSWLGIILGIVIGLLVVAMIIHHIKKKK